MNYYKKWLKTEKDWIDVNYRKIRNKMLFVFTPLVLVIMTVPFGGLELLREGEMSAVIVRAARGFMAGVFMCIIPLSFVMLFFRPGKFSKKIDKDVEQLGLSDAEKEQLGKEMLEADDRHRISYKEELGEVTMAGHKPEGTFARFVLTPHYAFLESSFPYSILVRLSDIAEICPSQKQEDTVTYKGETKTYQYDHTMYVIDFYRKDRAERGLADDPRPDVIMDFFREDIWNKVVELFRETDVPVKLKNC